MHDDSNILFKLELTKHKKSLNVNIHLNPHAQNVTVEEHTITWSPTKEEQLFLLEGLQLIKQQEMKNTTLVFNKKQNSKSMFSSKQVSSDSIRKDDDTTPLLCDEAQNENQWDSIDRIINKKLKT